jgi:hypothetical protein
MKYLFLCLLILSSTQELFAQAKEENRIWLGLLGRKNINSHLDFWAEAQLRHNENDQTMTQTLNRFGVLKKLNENNEIGFLFAYVQTGTTKEYRPTLQYVFKNIWQTNNISIRNRLEGRDIEDNKANSIRFRSQLRWARPINSLYDIVAWDEPFVNLTHERWTGDRFFERNRIFLGTRIKFEQISFEVGYMNQYTPRSTGNTSEHILTLYTFF